MMRKLLVGEVSVHDLVDRLAFAQEETQSAAVEQAKLFMAAATYRISKMKERQEAEAEFDDARTDKSVGLRKTNAASGKKGLTEKSIAELVDRDPTVRSCRDRALEAKRKEEWAKLLLEAYEHRRSTIRVLTQFAYIEDNFRPGGEEVDSMKRKRERLKKDLPFRDGDDDI